jgi:hypothetical protein
LNTKIRPAGRIECNREKRLDAVPVTSDLSKDFCINPLIKIILQSKALFTKALHCDTVPNTAFERQTLPPLYNRLNLISLPLNVRQAGQYSGRADGNIQDGRLSCLRLQKHRTQMTESVTACYQQSSLRDGFDDGTNARTQSA